MIVKTIPNPPNLCNISFVQTCKHSISKKSNNVLTTPTVSWFRNPGISSWLSQFNSLFTRVVYIPNGGLALGFLLQIPSCRARELLILHPPWWWRWEPTWCVGSYVEHGRALVGTNTHPQPQAVECLKMMIFPNLPKVGICFSFPGR